MDLNVSMNTTMTERFNVSGALLVKLFGRRTEETDDFAVPRPTGCATSGVRSAVYGRTFFVALGLVGALAAAAVYWIGGQLAISGSITPGTLVALATFVRRIYGPLTVADERPDRRDDRARVLRPGVRGARRPEPASRTAPAPSTSSRRRAASSSTTCGSPTRPRRSSPSLEARRAAPVGRRGAPAVVLHGVSAVIEPGQLVALVGPSGAGKTTLSQLIPRLYDVTSGAVRIDGHRRLDLTQESLRAAIGVVSQDAAPVPRHRSATTSATPGPAPPTPRWPRRCERPGSTASIASLPAGLDTLVGERGHRLSGGEKQRLAIARMLLKDPAIVILDEATSHLDSENEQLVQQALAHSLEGRTSLVIAHRLSTIQAADNILVLDEGRLVQQGTHAELLASGGLYADLYRILVRSELERT